VETRTFREYKTKRMQVQSVCVRRGGREKHQQKGKTSTKQNLKFFFHLFERSKRKAIQRLCCVICILKRSNQMDYVILFSGPSSV
jgi:hypothetical protein